MWASTSQIIYMLESEYWLWSNKISSRHSLLTRDLCFSYCRWHLLLCVLWVLEFRQATFIIWKLSGNMDSSKKWGFMGISTAVRLFTISGKQERWRAAMIPVDALAFLSGCRSGYKVAWQLEWMIFSLERSLARPMNPNVFMWPIYPAQLFENVRWWKWTVTPGVWY